MTETELPPTERRTLLTEGQRFLLLAVLIGVSTGLLVVCFHAAIEIGAWIVEDAGTGTALRVLIPGVGAAIAALVVHAVPASRGSGIVQTKSALYVSNGQIPFAAVPGKFVACVLSIGTGTPLGPEDPSLLMGAGLASRLGSAFGLARRSMRLVAPLGAAAGIAAAFNTPITGVLFVMEEVVSGWDASVLGSIILAAVSSVVTTRLFLGESPLFTVPDVAAIAAPREALVYLALGLAAGIFATAYIQGVALLRHRLGKTHLPTGVAPLLAGLMVGAVGLMWPEVLGTGYRAMDAALHSQYPWTTMAALAAAKLLVASLAFGAGTPGGLFAPTLFLGVMLGGAFGAITPHLLPLATAPQSTMALAGMAGVFAGVFRAPMTAVFMTFELSGTSASILPAMITASFAYLTARQLHRRSILDLVAEDEGAILPSARLPRPEEPLRIEDALARTETRVAVLEADWTVAAAERVVSATDADYALVYLPSQGWALLETDALRHAPADAGQTIEVGAWPGLARVGVAYGDELLDVALRSLALAPLVPVVSRLDERRLIGVLALDDVRRAYGFGGRGWAPGVTTAVGPAPDSAER